MKSLREDKLEAQNPLEFSLPIEIRLEMSCSDETVSRNSQDATSMLEEDRNENGS